MLNTVSYFLSSARLKITLEMMEGIYHSTVWAQVGLMFGDGGPKVEIDTC